MNVRWKVDGGKTNLRQGSFGNTHETLSLSQQNDYYKVLVFYLSCRVRFCHFIRCTRYCDVALRPHFHAYVVSVFTG